MPILIALFLLAFAASRLCYAHHAHRMHNDRGVANLELLLVGLVALLGTLLLVLTDHTSADNFFKIAGALISVFGGGTLGIVSARRDAKK